MISRSLAASMTVTQGCRQCERKENKIQGARACGSTEGIEQRLEVGLWRAGLGAAAARNNVAACSTSVAAPLGKGTHKL
jgi:hypothetical protein